MAKLTLTDITATYLAVTTINANSALIETALENTLSRDGTTPNTMSADFDMNSNRILNLPTATSSAEPVRFDQLTAAQQASLLGMAAELVTITDVAGNYVGITVEAALAEIWSLLTSVATGEGASLIGVEDAAANFTGIDIEAVLIELAGAAGIAQATEVLAGKAELATQAETDAGVDDTRIVTPLKLATSTTVPNVTEGSFTCTLDGMTVATTGTINYTIVDKMVMMTAEAGITGTSNTTAMAMSGLPAEIQNASKAAVPALVIDNSLNLMGRCQQDAIGEIIFSVWDGTELHPLGFTASGFKGIQTGWSILYPLLF